MKIQTVTGQVFEVTIDDSWTVRDLNEAVRMDCNSFTKKEAKQQIPKLK